MLTKRRKPLNSYCSKACCLTRKWLDTCPRLISEVALDGISQSEVSEAVAESLAPRPLARCIRRWICQTQSLFLEPPVI